LAVWLGAIGMRRQRIVRMKSLNGDLEALASALTENETFGPADLRAAPAGRDTRVARAVQRGAQVRTCGDLACLHGLTVLVPDDEPAGLCDALQRIVKLAAAHEPQPSVLHASTSKASCGLLYIRRIELAAQQRRDAAVVECRCALHVLAESPLDQFPAGRGLLQDLQQIALGVQESRLRGLGLG
jgi:hypothetical protein